jgi:hypothetical protein
MVLEKLRAMLQTCATGSPLFPPTMLYNEGWLLRLVLDWFSTHNVPNHPLTVPEDARWFSETLLPSAFLRRHKGDPLAESWTHADGVTGHFVIGSAGKADLSLLPDVTHFAVLEAKMFSRLSSGVKNARYFDQAARSVACIAEVLKRADRRPVDVAYLGFYVLAPHSQIAQGVFAEEMSRDSIHRKVEKRVQKYAGTKDQWYLDWFQPTFQMIDVRSISWEELIATIGEHDSTSASSIEGFYRQCIEFNRS